MKKDLNYTFNWIDINGFELGNFADDKEVMSYLISLRGREIFHMAGIDLKKDKDFLLTSIKRDPNIWYDLEIYADADVNYSYDKDIVLNVINHTDFIPMMFNDTDYRFYDTIFSDDNLSNDRDILLAIADKTPDELMYAGEEAKANKKTVLNIISKYGCFLEWVSDELKDDFEVVMEAITNDIHSFKYASQNLRYNKKLVAYAVNLIVYKACSDNIDIEDELESIISYTNKDCVDYINNYIKTNLNHDICLIKKKNN